MERNRFHILISSEIVKGRPYGRPFFLRDEAFLMTSWHAIIKIVRTIKQIFHTKNGASEHVKTFLVINTSYFGDTILTGALCRNIKMTYPDSRLVFIVNKPFCEVAQYLEGVDEVWSYDKKGEHRGIRGFLRFYGAYQGKYDIDGAFVIYGNERGIVLSKMLGAKEIYADNKSAIRVLLANAKIHYEKGMHTQDKHAMLWQLYTNQAVKSVPVSYNPPAEAQEFAKELLAAAGVQASSDDIVAICTTTKRIEKDMKLETCIELLQGLRSMGKVPLLVGAGDVALAYSKRLQNAGCDCYIDLTNKTSIAQLGALLQLCSSVVSVDTGTMHFALALDVPVVAVFYLNEQENLLGWAPKAFYRHRLLADGVCSAQSMLQCVRELDNETKG